MQYRHINRIGIKIYPRLIKFDPTKVSVVAVAAVDSSGEAAAGEGSARKRGARAKKESETEAAAAAPVPGIYHNMITMNNIFFHICIFFLFISVTRKSVFEVII